MEEVGLKSCFAKRDVSVIVDSKLNRVSLQCVMIGKKSS